MNQAPSYALKIFHQNVVDQLKSFFGHKIIHDTVDRHIHLEGYLFAGHDSMFYVALPLSSKRHPSELQTPAIARILYGSQTGENFAK